jgi:hypothetical protein
MEHFQCVSVGKTIRSRIFHTISPRTLIYKHSPLHLYSAVKLLCTLKDTGLLEIGFWGFRNALIFLEQTIFTGAKENGKVM